MKFIVTALLFLTCMTLPSTTEAFASRLTALQLRCQCIRTYSGKPIDPQAILKVQTIPAGAKCRDTQIIATLKHGQTCLSPKDEWVKKIIEGRFLIRV